MFQRFLVYLQLDRTFLFLIFLLSYVLVISNRVQAGVISWYTLTPEGPIAQFVSALLIFVLVRYWMNWLMAQKQQYRWQQYGLISLLSFLAYLALSNSSAEANIRCAMPSARSSRLSAVRTRASSSTTSTGQR